MEPWREVFRDGLAPTLTTSQLQALAVGLRTDDPALVQGATTCPPALHSVREWPCQGGCLISYAGWKADGIETVGGVDEFFNQTCKSIFDRTNLYSASRALVNWFDDNPRAEVFRELLPEVERALTLRSAESGDQKTEVADGQI